MLDSGQKQILTEACKTDFFKIFAEAINHIYMLECAKLTTCPPELLLRSQGVLQGIGMCRNIALYGTIEEPKKPVATPAMLMVKKK